MASTDWTSLTSGTVSFAIISDGTAPSPPDVMQVNTTGSAGIAFQNITGGTFKNSAVSGWMNQGQSNGSKNLMLCIRSTDNTTFIANPANFFMATMGALSTTLVRIYISAVVAGVETVILSADVTSQNGTPISTWQQFKFLSLNNGANVLLRISQWNGTVFVPIADAAAPIAIFPSLDASGSCRFGVNGAITQTDLIDNVAFYSLA